MAKLNLLQIKSKVKRNMRIPNLVKIVKSAKELENEQYRLTNFLVLLPANGRE